MIAKRRRQTRWYLLSGDSVLASAAESKLLHCAPSRRRVSPAPSKPDYRDICRWCWWDGAPRCHWCCLPWDRDVSTVRASWEPAGSS